MNTEPQANWNERVIGGIWEDAAARETVLVVQSHTRLRRALAEKLAGEFFRVAEASTGREAIGHARNTSPDVILLDLMLDDMPGLKVADRIRSDPRTRAIPILALSAEEVPRGAVIERGIDELLIMPVRLPVLIAAMERILEPHRCMAAQGNGRDPDQLEYELSDCMRSDHLTLATCFPAQVRFAVTAGNGPHVEAFKRRLARIGIAYDARLQGGDLQLTFRPTIAEALSLGLHRSAPDELLFALLDAYPELGVDPEGLRERVDQLEFAYERLQQLAS